MNMAVAAAKLLHGMQTSAEAGTTQACHVSLKQRPRQSTYRKASTLCAVRF